MSSSFEKYTLLHDFDNRLFLVPKYKEYEFYSDGQIYEVVMEKLNGEDIYLQSISFRYTITEKIDVITKEKIESYSEIHEDSLMVVDGIYRKYNVISSKTGNESNIFTCNVIIPFIEILEYTTNDLGCIF